MATFRSIIWHKLFLFSLHLLHFVGRILFEGQMASLKYNITACWLIRSVTVKLTVFEVQTTFLLLFAFADNVLYLTQLNSASCSWRCLIFCCCSSITPAFDGLKWTLLNGAAKYKDPLDDDVCVVVSESLRWLMYSMITDVRQSIQSFVTAKTQGVGWGPQKDPILSGLAYIDSHNSAATQKWWVFPHHNRFLNHMRLCRIRHDAHMFASLM